MSIINELDSGRRAFIAECGQNGTKPLVLVWTNTEIQMSTAMHHRLTRALVEEENRVTERSGRISRHVSLSGPTHMWGLPIVLDDTLPANTVRFSYDGVTTEITVSG